MKENYANMDKYDEKITITDLQNIIESKKDLPSVKANRVKIDNREKKRLSIIDKKTNKNREKTDIKNKKTVDDIVKKFYKAASNGKDVIWIYNRLPIGVIRTLEDKSFDVKAIDMTPVYNEWKTRGRYVARPRDKYIWELILNVGRSKSYGIRHYHYSDIYRVTLLPPVTKVDSSTSGSEAESGSGEESA